MLIDFNYRPEHRGTHRISGVNAEVYVFCSDTMRSPAQVLDYLQERDDKQPYLLEDVRQVLLEFCKAGFMLGEDDKFLSLALPSNPNG